MNTKITLDEGEIRKSSSTSSVFLSSTITAPNVVLLIKGVSTIIHSQLMEDMQLGKTVSVKSDLYFFSEEKYVNDFPGYFDEEKIRYLKKTPTQEEIGEFIEALYNCSQFSPECCVLCLIYINRIIALTGLSLQPTNWRPLLLVSLMVSQKVWDDKYLSNADFSYIYPFFDNEQLNLLEMKFLEMIQYNVHIKDSLYAKYYFELRSLYPDELPNKAMDKFTLNKMDSVSKEKEDKMKKYSKTTGDNKQPGEFSYINLN